MSSPISPSSQQADVAAVEATNTSADGGLAIHGYSAHGHGVEGGSEGSKGVVGTSRDYQGVFGHSDKNAGVVGESATWVGVYGSSRGDKGVAIMGEARVNAAGGIPGNGIGVLGVSTSGTGVDAASESGIGVHGYSAHGHGVEGGSEGSKGVVGTSRDYQGVFGHSDKNAGVVGESATWVGVYGSSRGDKGVAIMGEARANAAGGIPGNGIGVLGVSTSGTGVDAASESGEAIHAVTNSGTVAAVAAYNTNPLSVGAALFAKKAGTAGDAGFFEGNVHITGTCTVDLDVLCTGADLAEQFEVVGDCDAQPGSVVVLAGDDRVRISESPYDRRVAGVVSGAGSYRPAMVLDNKLGPRRRALALTGKVWCKVDAGRSGIAVGDLLTSSAVPGHAMKADDPARAFGCVIGKALANLSSGRGLIPVLVALQ